MSKVRVHIATTNGPVEVQRIVEEDPDVRSVVCLNGTSEALPISAAYDAFVRKPTGVVERETGHSVYRMDVAGRISEGRSWQLGVYAAHRLYRGGRLAAKGEAADEVWLLTGEVDNDLNVGTVAHVVEKVARAHDLFDAAARDEIAVTVFVPAAGAVPDLDAFGIAAVRPVASVGDIFEGSANPVRAQTVRPRRAGRASWVAFGAVLAGLAALAAGLGAGGLRQVLSSAGMREIVLESMALRGPDCAAPHEEPLGESDGVIAPASGGDLCAVRHRIRNTGGRTLSVWLALYRDVDGRGEFRSRRDRAQAAVAPGGTLAVDLVLSPWQRPPVGYSVVAVAGSDPASAVAGDVAALVAAPADRRRAILDGFRRQGLAVVVASHAVLR